MVFELFRTGQASDVEIAVRNPSTQQLEIIKGTLESGAFTTAGSYQMHQKYCKATVPITKEVYLVLPNKQVLRPKTAGIMDLTATNNQKETNGI